ncbi:MAG TPA: hypothetical protein VHV49_12820 [Pseudonocardiaceae bacterium]|jgi:hypothetical protein|nr:hypothetical protein [Pseudonocardiaceae bacterium]
MRRTVVGAVAVVAAASVFMLGGLGMASASAMLPNTSPGASAGFSPTSEATALRTLHDTLETQWSAKDATGMRDTQSALATELAKLQTPQGKAGLAAMSPRAASEAGQALRENDQLGQALAALQADHGKSASDLPVPGLGSLTSLIQSLLATLLSIITGLLGGLPVPVPVPPVTPPVTAHAAG